MVWLV